jgi:hypothetical protein
MFPPNTQPDPLYSSVVVTAGELGGVPPKTSAAVCVPAPPRPPVLGDIVLEALDHASPTTTFLKASRGTVIPDLSFSFCVVWISG